VSLAGHGSADVLLHEADTAMYQAKARGGDRVETFDADLGRLVKVRSNARRSLQSALNDRRITLHYQPIIDLASGRLAGFEALARIAEPDGTIAPPSAFIPVAEKTGLIVPLGTEVLRIACQQAGTLPVADPVSGPSVAVNLSGRQFVPGDLPALVRNALDLNSLDPRRLHLELTETAIIDIRPDVINQLHQLREIGVEIGLDDFGTGYSSLTHLRQLPLTFVKIDQTFVDGLGTNRSDDLIVAAIIDLARNLGLRSIAEGVETPEQLATLRRLHCEQAQGYLFARPLPRHDLRTAASRTNWNPPPLPTS
jgi:EAL domain-containing protein (putative c-di-GMP-specific phosphodiesterase class I)